MPQLRNTIPKQFARVGKARSAAIINQQISTYSVLFRHKSIADWQRGINQMQSVDNPNRGLIFDIYDGLIDGHLESVMEKRKFSILNRVVEFLPDGQKETPDNIKEFVTHTPWMRDTLEYMTEAKPYGFSLLEYVPRGGFIQEVINTERRNVIPEWNALLYDQHNRNEGINYLDDPMYSKYMMFIGGKKTYGKLMNAAQYVILKRGGISLDRKSVV